jgi:BirA family biotin operon repressor/biotin-[acetyl-CoA-carboxylase] ligase
MPNFRDRGTDRARELRNVSTPAERHLWRYLRNKQLGARFNRQLKVGSFFPDFLCRELKLIVEVDGFSHDVQPERDIMRNRLLAEAGYRVLHFSNEDVLENVGGVVTVIQLEIERLTLP